MRNDTRIVDENGKPFRTVTRFKDFSDVIGDIYQVFCRGIATPQINIEIGVPMDRAPALITRIREWHAREQPHMHYPIILRCTGPSDAWLSPSWQQPTCFFGFVVYYAEDGSLSEEGLLFARGRNTSGKRGREAALGEIFRRQPVRLADALPAVTRFQGGAPALDPRVNSSMIYGGAAVMSAAFAWVTLLTQPGYVPGVEALRHSLQKSGSPWPLVVMVTPAIDAGHAGR
jgi:hypothetical protein